jgi:tetratricopeptide (TPR) repeat protein
MADPEASPRIFISYRREDSSGHVLALLPSLRKHFGDRIFKDTDNIPPGEDFVKFIKHELQSCSVLLAIIGKDWLTVRDPRLRTRRLDNPDDFLRVELATALGTDRIRVIPVLIERATMPAAMDLPEDIAALAQRNALELSDVRWESDVQLLIQAIQRACAGPVATAEPPTPQWPELQDVQKRRAREIASHLSNARQAFVARNYEATLLACEKVLLLDPQNVEALDLLDLARTTTDEQRIETWLTQARQSLDRGDISSTSDLIDQALALDPNLEPALALRNRVLALRRERERGRDRARVAAGAVDRARTRLEEQKFESAVRHADDALSLDPQSVQAREIREKASGSLDDRRPGRDRAAFWSFRRYGGLAAAAAVVILIFAIWSGIYFLGSRSTPPAQSSQPASAPSTTAATEPAPATPPPVSPVPVQKPAAAAQPGTATDEDPRQQRVPRLRQVARDQFQRGQRVALNTVMTGLTIAPEDTELRSILDSMLSDAQRITRRSKAAAISAGAANDTQTYHEARAGCQPADHGGQEGRGDQDSLDGRGDLRSRRAGREAPAGGDREQTEPGPRQRKAAESFHGKQQFNGARGRSARVTRHQSRPNSTSRTRAGTDSSGLPAERERSGKGASGGYRSSLRRRLQHPEPCRRVRCLSRRGGLAVLGLRFLHAESGRPRERALSGWLIRHGCVHRHSHVQAQAGAGAGHRTAAPDVLAPQARRRLDHRVDRL